MSLKEMDGVWEQPSSTGKGLSWLLFFRCFSLVSANKLLHSLEVFLQPEQLEHFVKFRSIFLENFPSIFKCI